MSVRGLCLSVLEQVLYQGGKLNQLTEDTAVKEDLEERDARFLKFLCFGVTEKYPMLLSILKRYTKNDPQKLRPRVRIILCMGLYEMFFMNTRDHAVVSEALKLAQKRGFKNLKGFINGVLRAVLRDRDKVLDELSPREKSCLPDPLWNNLLNWYGEEKALKIAESYLKEEHTVTVRRIRSNGDLKTFEKMCQADGIGIEKSLLDDTCFFLKDLHHIPETGIFKEGLVYIQDLSSQLDAFVIRDLTEGKSVKVLDVCASPGGKSICLYDDSGKKALLTSCDINDNKTARIRENLDRLKFQDVRTVVRDASEEEKDYLEAFDIVIADVPCSGIGTLRKKPDIRYNITPEYLRGLYRIQEKILNNVSRYVKPGGTLLYSTCTINPEENENRISRFLEASPDFEETDIKACIPSELTTEKVSFGVLMLPGDDNDGFYICRMKKKNH